MQSNGGVEKPSHDQIAALAFNIYLERGSQPGHEESDWLEAERRLKQQASAQSAPSLNGAGNGSYIPKSQGRQDKIRAVRSAH